MPKSRVLAVLTLLVLSMVLAACGNDDSADPTAEPTATRSPVLPTEMPGTTEQVEVSPTATELATPTEEQAATPNEVAMATPAVMNVASPAPVDVAATPVVAATTPQATPAVASPIAEDLSTPVQATLVLNGTAQVDYIITSEGCVGLGQWSGLRPGAQVVVRDADGTVVDIGDLQAGDGDCSWVADISVPGSEFVSIGIPMVTEVWFSQADLESGEVEITLP